MRRMIPLLVVAAILVTSPGCSGGQKQTQGAVTPTSTAQPTATPAPTSSAPKMAEMPPASEFVTQVTNPWFPLTPGSKWVYRGVKDAEPTVDTFVVTPRKKTILGVSATVVVDTLTSGKRIVEATEDWYAQDSQGNVWYLGEATREFDESGKVTSTEGSWEAGVNGAKAGLFMPADPQVGMSFYQEYLKGEAEDAYKIVSLTATITVPAGTYQSSLQTEESTALEPGILTQKNYVKGIGEVYENDVKGPAEYSKLITYTVK